MQKDKELNTLGVLKLYEALIASCFEPIRVEYETWQSFKDKDNLWKKKKVKLKQHEIDKNLSEEISSRRFFLCENRGLHLLNDVNPYGGKSLCQRLAAEYDEFVRNGAKGGLRVRLKI